MCFLLPPRPDVPEERDEHGRHGDDDRCFSRSCFGYARMECKNKTRSSSRYALLGRCRMSLRGATPSPMGSGQQMNTSHKGGALRTGAGAELKTLCRAAGSKGRRIWSRGMRQPDSISPKLARHRWSARHARDRWVGHCVAGRQRGAGGRRTYPMEKPQRREIC